jgi:hypothetical protein
MQFISRGSSLLTAVAALTLLSLVVVYGQHNGAGSDDNGERLSTSSIFFKVPFFLIFAGICGSPIWAMQLISFLLSICLTGIKKGRWTELSPFWHEQTCDASVGPHSVPLSSAQNSRFL